MEPPSTPMDRLEERLASIDQVLVDPPQVHPAPTGVWHTERSCYELLARHCPPGTRSLETGLGVSTVLFALWGAQHTAVVFEQSEVDSLHAHCAERGIPTDRLDLHVGGSDEILPALSATELDLVFVDGAHGFPAPILDWYYAGSRLRHGGVIVFDDVNLPSVRWGLMAFLDLDPRWEAIATTPKWGAYRRAAEGVLREDWYRQKFLDQQEAARRTISIRSLAGRVRRAARTWRGR